MANIDGNGSDNDLFGGSDGDTINGFGGDDYCLGNDGDDLISGGDDDDDLYGGNGFDELYGGAGNDLLQGIGTSVVLTTDAPSDVIDGGTGTADTLVINYATFVIVGTGDPAAVIVDISTGTGEVDVSGFRGENFTHVERLLFSGPDGDDHATGRDLDDNLAGRGGDDVLKGAGGDDIMSDSWGFIDADGGSGTDSFLLNRADSTHGDTAAAIIDGTLGTIKVGGVDMGTFRHFETLTVIAGSGNDTLIGLNAGINNLFGGTGKDTITGKTLADTLYGNSEADDISGNAGDDTIYGGLSNDTIRGGTGNDTIFADEGKDNVHGDAGDDIVMLNPDANLNGAIYFGDSGSDTFQLIGGSVLNVDFTAATLRGFETLNTDGNFFSGPNTITMAAAQMAQFTTIHLWGIGEDFVIKFSDDANVVMPAVTVIRTIQLANGGQQIDFSAVTGAVATLNGGTGSDTVIGKAVGSWTTNLNNGSDHFTGGGASDTVHGGNGNDTVDGGTGGDTLTGDGGKDTLNGGDGNDNLNGGAAADSLDGGTGAGLDKFAYAQVSDSTGANFDTVAHFDANAQDRFDFTFAVGGTDTKVITGDLSDASFNSDLVSAIGTHELKLGHAVLFTPDGGQYAGKTFLIVDANNHAGYQADVDFVFLLTQPAHLANFDTADFT